jgi:hypothetical protein
MRKFGYIVTKRGMKIYGLIILAALISTALIMHGQEAAPPSVDLYENQPEPTPPPPPNGPELPELKQLDETFKPPSLGTDADATKLRVEWRQLRNRTVNDPEVKAAKAYAQAARTDLEERNRLRDYYNIYYQRMSLLTTNAEIKVALEAFKGNHQSLLAQPRVRPSPTPEGATPTPTPSGTPAPKKPAHKHKKQNQKWHLGAALPPALNIVFLQASRFVARSSSG